jgi:hypothetical protein
VAGKVRRAFFRTVENMKNGGTIAALADIFALAKFVPKEMMVEHDTMHRLILGEASDVAAVMGGPVTRPSDLLKTTVQGHALYCPQRLFYG